MGKDLSALIFWGLIFVAIGLWLRRKDRKKMELMEAKLWKKENDLYELYGALEEIMEELISIGKTKKKDIEAGPISRGHNNETMGEQPLNVGDRVTIGETIPYEAETVSIYDEETPDKRVNRYEKVVTLKRQGHSEEEIAKELNIGIGEVKLITEFYDG